MKNSKLVAEAKRNPRRIYHRPTDILRDRRLDDAGRREILLAWEQEGRVAPIQPVPLHELQEALREIEQRLRP